MLVLIASKNTGASFHDQHDHQRNRSRQPARKLESAGENPSLEGPVNRALPSQQERAIHTCTEVSLQDPPFLLSPLDDFPKTTQPPPDTCASSDCSSGKLPANSPERENDLLSPRRIKPGSDLMVMPLHRACR